VEGWWSPGAACRDALRVSCSFHDFMIGDQTGIRASDFLGPSGRVAGGQGMGTTGPLGLIGGGCFPYDLY
jgi:hypothetical protein